MLMTIFCPRRESHSVFGDPKISDIIYDDIEVSRSIGLMYGFHGTLSKSLRSVV